MRYNPLQKAVEYNKNHRRRRRWHQVVSVMASIVVFCTTYALILPAITMEDLTCTVTEHSHGPECYSEVTEFVCMAEEGEGHQHDDRCFTEVDKLVCMADEAEAHHHDDECYGEDGALICALQETDGHKHESSCYVKERVLACELPEAPEHYHSDEECYAVGQVLTCGISQHTHDKEKCYAHDAEPEPEEDIVEGEPVANEYFCGYAEHIEHSEDCYDAEGSLICELELHAHDENCAVEPEIEVEVEEGPAENFMVLLPQGEKIPEGYEADPYTYTDNATFGVTVYHDGTAFPEGAEVYLKADQLLAESEDEAIAEAYAQAEQTLLDEAVEYDGMLAFDIRFEDADGEEVEPASPVYVVINAKGLIPADADAETVAVQHHSEIEKKLLSIIPVGTEIEMDIVADMSEETGTIAAVVEAENEGLMDLATMFEVESFSSFTITWRTTRVATIYYVDTAGNPLNGSGVAVGNSDSFDEYFTVGSTSEYIQLDSNIQDQYEYLGAHLDSIDGDIVTRLRKRDNNLRCYDEDGEYTNLSNGAEIYLVYQLKGQSISFAAIDTYNKELGNVTVGVPETDTAIETIAGGAVSGYELADAYLTDGTKITTLRYENDTLYANRDKVITASDVTLVYDDGRIRGVTPAGVTVHMFNYNGTTMNGYSDFDFTNAGVYNNTNNTWNSWTGQNGGVTQNIVQPMLNENGMPVLTGTTTSLEYLFGTTELDGKVVYDGLSREDGYGLFIPDGNGHYSYDSAINFAQYVKEGETEGFRLYNRASNARNGNDEVKFAPFNDIDEYDNNGYHMGMHIFFDFLMPNNGQLNGEDMIFEFSGDDDVWVFIDDLLILDIGGIHLEQSGTINFATGEVYVYNNVNDPKTVIQKTSIYDIAVAKLGDGADAWISEHMEEVNGNWLLKEHVTHSLDFFYLERGAGGSNCMIQYNLPTIESGSLLVRKEVKDYHPIQMADLTYTMEVKVDAVLYANQSYYIYPNKSDTHTTDSIGRFVLKHDQIAVFEGIEGNSNITVTEVAVQPEPSTQQRIDDLYTVKYSATDDDGTDVTDKAVDGAVVTMPPAGTATVNITNGAKFTSEIDIVKTFDGLTNDEIADVADQFSFQVYESTNGTEWTAIGDPIPYTDFVTNAETGVVSYTLMLMEGKYYKVEEIVGESPNVSDELVYRNNTVDSNDTYAELTLADGVIYLEQAGTVAETVAFANFYGAPSADITLGKTVTINGTPIEATNSLYGTAYEFVLSMDAANAGEYVVEYVTSVTADNAVKHENGMIEFVVDGETAKATINLYHGETATIKGMPIGAVVTVVEQNTDGYSVNWTDVNGITTKTGNAEQTITVAEGAGAVCINTTGYELPSTGGIGTMIYTISGSVVMGAAALVGGIGLKRRRERGQDE